MNKCICEWCNRVQNRSGRGYCRKHYDQIREYGKVLDTRTRCDDNRIIRHDDYSEIVITDSKDNELCKALISNEDINKINGHRWTLNNNGYVRTFNKTTPVYLHRLLTDCPNELEVDHINHNKLDNRRGNLRVVTHSANMQNNNGKCYRRITDRNLAKPFFVQIVADGEIKVCKYYRTEVEAQKAVESARNELMISG